MERMLLIDHVSFFSLITAHTIDCKRNTYAVLPVNPAIQNAGYSRCHLMFFIWSQSLQSHGIEFLSVYLPAKIRGGLSCQLPSFILFL